MTKTRKKIFIILLFFSFTTAAFALYFKAMEAECYYQQKAEAADIIPIISKDTLNDADYKTLFYQTGLGKTAVDEVLRDKINGMATILKYQNRFLSKADVKCERIFITTKSELLSGKDNLLAPVKDGYILITKACHTLGWRHGHAAIVTDAANEQTLESILIGSNSEYQTLEKWRHQPNVIILRAKNLTDGELKQIAEYSKQSLCNVPYNMFSGVIKTKDKLNAVKGTNCSHLVWQAFNRYGINIDSNGGLFVTPRNIALSPKLEIVQIIGVNPNDIW